MGTNQGVVVIGSTNRPDILDKVIYIYIYNLYTMFFNCLILRL